MDNILEKKTRIVFEAPPRLKNLISDINHHREKLGIKTSKREVYIELLTLALSQPQYREYWNTPNGFTLQPPTNNA